MLIPDPALVAKLDKHFGRHHCFHQARSAGTPPPFQFGYQTAGAPGSGVEFLDFHRSMCRIFAKIIQDGGHQVPGCEAWPLGSPVDLPPHIRTKLTGAQQRAADQALVNIRARLAQDGPSPDVLGIVIELELHNPLHGWIGAFEQPTDPPSGMEDMSIAPRNEHFWGLHGWIDKIEAHWRETFGRPFQDPPVYLDFINDLFPNGCGRHSGHHH